MTLSSDKIVHVPFASLWNVAEVYVEYGLYGLPDIENARVLDIGANVGIFSIQCTQRWLGSQVRAYEPHPETYEMLTHNVSGLKVETHRTAVTHGLPPGDVELHEGRDNRLCCSIHDIGAQRDTEIVQVPTLDSSELPPCDVLKIDTEGCEVDILRGYQYLDKVKVLLLEIHRTSDFIPVENLAKAACLTLLGRVGNTQRWMR